MSGQSSSAASDPQNILVRGVNWLGDAVMTTPAMQRLRERFPQSRITILTSEKLSELWVRQSSVDAIMTFSRADNPWSVARRLRDQRFEAAVVMPNSPRSAFEVWLAGIPRRIGYARRWRNWFLSELVAYQPDRARPCRRRASQVKHLTRERSGQEGIAPRPSYAHQMHDYLRLMAALGSNPIPLPPKLEVSAAEVDAAAQTFLARFLGAKDSVSELPPIYIGLNPSAAYGPAKRWPLERFAQVTGEVCSQVRNCVWLLFGAAEDWEICEEISKLRAGRMVNLAGKTSLRQLMALLQNCRVLLTNDSGPMHVAAALGTPVVVPFGSTSPELTGPGEPGDPRHHLLRANAACSPCFRRTCPIDFRCMTGIPVDAVVKAVLESLSAG